VSKRSVHHGLKIRQYAKSVSWGAAALACARPGALLDGVAIYVMQGRPTLFLDTPLTTSPCSPYLSGESVLNDDLWCRRLYCGSLLQSQSRLRLAHFLTVVFAERWFSASTPKTQAVRVFAHTFPKTFFILEESKMAKLVVKKKKRLTAQHVKFIMESWSSMSLDEIAGQLGVTPNTVRMMVSSIRKVDPEKCLPKPRNRKSREDVVREALTLLNTATA
jgi:hypothetical protein